MIFYHDSIDLNLRDFGIEIPLLDERAKKIISSLSSDSVLKCNKSEWLNQDYQAWSKINYSDLTLAHTHNFVERLKSKDESLIIEAYELIDQNGKYKRYNPSNAKKSLKEMFGRELKHVNATYSCFEQALQTKFSYFLGGGAHHAMDDHPSGFCMINDIVVGLKKLQSLGKIKNALVIDVDAHKGDGTAYLTRKDHSIFTMSLHMSESWPLDVSYFEADEKRKKSFTVSNIDLSISEKDQESYLEYLELGLNKIKEMLKFSREIFDLCVVVDGSDAYEKDLLESTNALNLSKEVLFQRNKMIYEFHKHYDIPAAYLMSGGYGHDNWEIHHQFIKHALYDSLKLNNDNDSLRQ